MVFPNGERAPTLILVHGKGEAPQGPVFARSLLPSPSERQLHADVSRTTEKKILAGSLSASVQTNRTAIDYAFGLRSRGSCNCAVLFSCARGLVARGLLA